MAIFKKKIKVVIFFTTVVIFSLSFLYWLTYTSSTNVKKVSIKGHVFFANVVSSDEELQKGLGGVDDICDQCAMLFQFKRAETHNFWMKGMLFSIDIIWILQGKIVYMEKNIQPEFKRILIPSVASDRVLEINAGKADEFDFKLGDEVSIRESS